MLQRVAQRLPAVIRTGRHRESKLRGLVARYRTLHATIVPLNRPIDLSFLMLTGEVAIGRLTDTSFDYEILDGSDAARLTQGYLLCRSLRD
jgi:hypothetical protein